jgi:arsenite oxidase small subunit
MIDVGRRKFLTGAGVAAAGVAASAVMVPSAAATPPLARVSYPSNRLANVSDLKLNDPLAVSYPDADAPGVLI